MKASCGFPYKGCKCFEQMGNDFWFLPVDRCLYEENSVPTTERAFYFGCIGGAGHYLHTAGGNRTLYDLPLGIPWTLGNMDGGLLKNGKVPDKETGQVHWTCGGRDSLWFAFFWWDNSVDRRGASNSGFYVEGFARGEAEKAFKFACEAFPAVVSRQRCALTLK